MKIKRDSSDELIKMSETIHNEITRDIMETFGIDLTQQQLEYHDKSRPLLTQQIRDNKSLKIELDLFLNLVKNNADRLPRMIRFENEHPLSEIANYSKDSISCDLEFLWICEAHVKKFENEKYLSEREISRYYLKIQKLKDTIKNITILQNL